MENVNLKKELLTVIKNINDFPIKGVVFRDLTPILSHKGLLKKTIDQMLIFSKHLNFDCIISPESRGYWFGAPLAYASNVPFVPARKPGKLPRDVISQNYYLEYGNNVLQIHSGDVKPNSRVLIVDDLIATGGTIAALIELTKKSNAIPVGCIFCASLSELKGIEFIKSKYDVPCFKILDF